MKNVTLYMGGGAALLGLWVLLYRHATIAAYAKPQEIASIPKITYILDNPTMAPAPTSDHRQSFDWLGGDCLCENVKGSDTIVIDEVSFTRVQPGYYPIVPRYVDIPPYLKGGLPLFQNPVQPPLLSYSPAVPTFWWSWQGLSRVIITSDGATLRTGSQNKLWKDVTPGRNALSQITMISYNAQTYQLDKSKSSGL